MKIIQDLVKSEAWKIVKESVDYWCLAKSREVVELHGAGEDDEAKELSRQVHAVERVFSEPEMIIQKTGSFLKKLKWMEKIFPNKEKTVEM